MTDLIAATPDWLALLIAIPLAIASQSAFRDKDKS